MTKTISNEQIDPRSLVLDDKFQARQTGLIHDDKSKAAAEISRQQQIQNVLTSLESGNSIRIPIEAFELNGQLYVVDGFHRTEACQKFIKKNKNAEFTVPVVIHRGYTEAEAYLDSLTKNQEHGTALSPSERMQNQFKRHLMQGENIDIDGSSKRKLAKEYDCGDTQGLHILNALKACIEAGLPSSSEWSANHSKATEKLKRALKKTYEDLEQFDFDKDGFPIIRRLADASTGLKEYPCEQSEEEIRRKKVIAIAFDLEVVIGKHGGDCFRDALKRLDRQALGLTIKREWDESAVKLKYNPEAYDAF